MAETVLILSLAFVFVGSSHGNSPSYTQLEAWHGVEGSMEHPIPSFLSLIKHAIVKSDILHCCPLLKHSGFFFLFPLPVLALSSFETVVRAQHAGSLTRPRIGRLIIDLLLECAVSQSF